MHSPDTEFKSHVIKNTYSNVSQYTQLGAWVSERLYNTDDELTTCYIRLAGKSFPVDDQFLSYLNKLIDSNDIFKTRVKSLDSTSKSILIANKNTFIELDFQHSNNTVIFSVASFDKSLDFHNLFSSFTKYVEVPKTNEDKIIKCNFWYRDSRGNYIRDFRELEYVTNDNIKSNYPKPTFNQLDKLINWFPQIGYEGGKLIIFHGPPGTGKTSFIRALSREWSPWCSTSVITDPEEFLGEAAYTLYVLKNPVGTISSEDYAKYYEDDDSYRAENHEDRINSIVQTHFDTESRTLGNKWHLIVLEDCSELLNAKTKTSYQAFSRLLNYCDGLLGQGMKILTLITTNEDISELHPAIKRPGRCRANICFDLFNQSQAIDWATNHFSQNQDLLESIVSQIKSSSSEQLSLADLYEMSLESKDRLIVPVARKMNTGTYL